MKAPTVKKPTSMFGSALGQIEQKVPSGGTGFPPMKKPVRPHKRF